jgi:hypothetical protein
MGWWPNEGPNARTWHIARAVPQSSDESVGEFKWRAGQIVLYEANYKYTVRVYCTRTASEGAP